MQLSHRVNVPVRIHVDSPEALDASPLRVHLVQLDPLVREEYELIGARPAEAKQMC